MTSNFFCLSCQLRMYPPSSPTRSGWSAPAGSCGSARSPCYDSYDVRGLGAEVGLMADGDPVQVAANGRGVGAAADRQDLLQQLGGQAVGDQRRPAGFQVEQLRRGVLGQQ